MNVASPTVRAAPWSRAAPIALFALAGLALAVATAARLGGPPAAEPPVRARLGDFPLSFHDRADGSVMVAAAGGGEARLLAAGTHNFVRGVMRGLARERRRRGIGEEPPFLLTSWDDGALTLSDPATGRRIELGAFGPVNLDEFRQLLPVAGTP